MKQVVDPDTEETYRVPVLDNMGQPVMKNVTVEVRTPTLVALVLDKASGKVLRYPQRREFGPQAKGERIFLTGEEEKPEEPAEEKSPPKAKPEKSSPTKEAIPGPAAPAKVSAPGNEGMPAPAAPANDGLNRGDKTGTPVPAALPTPAKSPAGKGQ